MSVFVTSDGHIGHYAVAYMRWEDFARRGWDFPEWESREQIVAWHSEMLAQRWDSVVGKDDIVYHLGDLSMDGKANAENALAWIKERPGKKRFVPGNHDPVMPGVNRDAGKWMSRYLEAFEWVFPYYRYKIAGISVLMSHFPYQGGGDHTLNERYRQYRLPYLGEWLLHGHTHSSDKMWDGDPEAYPGAARQIHVGVDAHDYTPVPMEEIARIITAHGETEVGQEMSGSGLWSPA